MNILNFINLRVFIVTFLAGLLILYHVMPNEDIVYVYPTPENVDLIQYKDRADNCYSVNKKEVECPEKSSFLSHIPIQ